VELVTLSAAVLRLRAFMDRLLPDRNHRFTAVKGLCATRGPLGFGQLHRKATEEGQGFVTRKFILTRETKERFFHVMIPCKAEGFVLLITDMLS
jgi:hypothetical protein